MNVFRIEADLDMSAKAGAHLELEVEMKQDTDLDFGVDVEVRIERNITQVDGDGNRTLLSGKVDAYRFMMFYLRPDSDHHNVFFNQVVDPIWLGRATSRPRWRCAKQPSQRPACWRVLHRVTYVSRILAPVSPQVDDFTRAMRSLDISGNYEMVKTLEPYVVGRMKTYGDFVTVVKKAVASRLPRAAAAHRPGGGLPRAVLRRRRKHPLAPAM